MTRTHASVLRYLTLRQLLEENGLRPAVGEDEGLPALARAALLGPRSAPG